MQQGSSAHTTYCRGEKWRGRGCLEGRGKGSEKAVGKGGVLDDSHINTATLEIMSIIKKERKKER